MLLSELWTGLLGRTMLPPRLDRRYDLWSDGDFSLGPGDTTAFHYLGAADMPARMESRTGLIFVASPYECGNKVRSSLRMEWQRLGSSSRSALASCGALPRSKVAAKKMQTAQKAFGYFVFFAFFGGQPGPTGASVLKSCREKAQTTQRHSSFLVFVFWRPAAVRSKVAARKRKRHKRQVAFFRGNFERRSWPGPTSSSSRDSSKPADSILKLERTLFPHS